MQAPLPLRVIHTVLVWILLSTLSLNGNATTKLEVHWAIESTTPHGGDVDFATICPNSNRAALLYRNGTLFVVSIPEREVLFQARIRTERRASLSQRTPMSFSSDGRLLATRGNPGVINIWNIDEQRAVRSFHIPQNARAQALRFLSDDENLLLHTTRGKWFRINITSGLTDQVSGFEEVVYNEIIPGPKGTLVAQGGTGITPQPADRAPRSTDIILIDANTGEFIRSITRTGGGLTFATVCPDDSLLISFSDKRFISCHTGGLEQPFRVPVDGSYASYSTFVDSEDNILRVSLEGEIVVFNSDPFSLIEVRQIEDRYDGRLVRNGKLLNIDGEDTITLITRSGGILLWPTKGGVPTHNPPQAIHRGANLLAFSHDSQRLASVHHRQVAIWDVPAGTRITNFVLPSMNFNTYLNLTFSPDRTWLTATTPREILVYSAETGEQMTEGTWNIQETLDLRSFMSHLTWAPDSSRIAFRVSTRRLIVKDFPSGEVRYDMTFEHELHDIAFEDPDTILVVEENVGINRVALKDQSIELVRSLPRLRIFHAHLDLEKQICIMSTGRNSIHLLKLNESSPLMDLANLVELHSHATRAAGRHASSSGLLFIPQQNSFIHYWDVGGIARGSLQGNNLEMITNPHRGAISRMIVSPCGQFIASAGQDGTLKLLKP